jgi:hypothetical protein
VGQLEDKMMNNKHGQVIAYTLMLGTVIIILALALAPVVKEQVDNSRNATNMDCSNASVSNFVKATCVISDISIFYFIGGLVFIAGAVITARVVFG